MINIIFILFTYLNIAFAGGDVDAANIKKLYFDDEGYLSIEIEWLNTNGFISKDEVTHLSFRYHQIRNQKLFDFVQRWSSKDNRYKNVQSTSLCLNKILSSFKNNKPVLIGQMGTSKFRRLEKNSIVGIVSFAEIKKTFDAKEACVFYTS